MQIKSLIFILIILLYSGCGVGSNINIANYKKDIHHKINLDDNCRYLYEQENKKVAVVEFTNNSSFGRAKINDSKKKSSASIGLDIFSIGANSKNNNSSVKRTVDPKLSEAFVPLIENMLVNTQGVNLFTRTDLDKVDTELKLQDSGLLDPNSIVEFGLNSGVEYIITGSIDYISHNFKNYSQSTKSLPMIGLYSRDKDLAIAGIAAHFAASLFNGTTIKSALTVKIIDVASGKIVFTKQIKKETKLSGDSEPTYGQLTDVVKESISESLPALKEEFQKEFQVRTYISALKTDGKEYLAKINLGKKSNIIQGDEFEVYEPQVSIDPLTNKASCENIKTNISLVASNIINEKSAWLIVDKNKENKIKILQIVKSSKE